MDTAIYWIEYVGRHGGAPHLRVGALDLSWCEYFLLDVIAVITIIIGVALFIFYKVTKLILKKFCKKSKKVKTN